MASLTPVELRSRLAFDYRVMMGLRSPALGAVRAFASEADLRAGREVTTAQGERGGAVLYLVEYRFPILTGPGQTVEGATARFNLLAGPNYPYSRPTVEVVSRPLPWSPHVLPGPGTVCLGEGWVLARGRMLAGQLVGHVMHLLNFDEPDRGPGYHGFSTEAIKYWREVLGGRPLHPDLPYPLLPSAITHGVAEAEAEFRAVSGDGLSTLSEPTFVALGFASRDEPDGFVPLGGVL